MLRVIALAVTVAIAFPVFPTPAESRGGHPRIVRVMTRNIYLGGALLPLATAPDLTALALAGSTLWLQVQATDFRARARALAAEIREADPLLIGLQEAAIWRTGVADGPPIFGGSPAADVALDFLEILLDELEAVDSPYDVVVVQPAADLEIPTASGFDIRLTLRDAILAKANLPNGQLRVTNSQSGNFGARLDLPVPVPGADITVPILRGWTAVDVRVHQESEAFSNCGADRTGL